jgi:cellobiose phosphorylase
VASHFAIATYFENLSLASSRTFLLASSSFDQHHWSNLLSTNRLGVEAILGLKRRGGRLEIDPCIPNDWTEYELTYLDGDTSYVICVSNPQGVNRGVIRTTLDGNIVPNDEIPLSKDGGRHEVQIELGRMTASL